MERAIKPIETVYNGYRFRSRLEARWAVFFDALGVEYEYEPEGFTFTDSGNNTLYYLPDFKVMCHGRRGITDDWPFALYIEVKGDMTEDDAHKLNTFCAVVAEEFEKAKDKAWNANVADNHHCRIADLQSKLNELNPDYDDYPFYGAKPSEREYILREALTYETRQVDLHTKQYISDHSRFKHGTMDGLLVVGNIPDVNSESDCVDYCIFRNYDNMGTENETIHAYNYETIDGDYFAAYPAATKDGKFYLMGDDTNYINHEDLPQIAKAYQIARQARFEHGETPTKQQVWRQAHSSN